MKLIFDNILSVLGSISVYYTTQTKQINRDSVINILTGTQVNQNNQDSFVKRLLMALNNINQKYIWLIQEDHWYFQIFSKHIFAKIISTMDKFDLDQIKLDPIAYSCTEAPGKDVSNEMLYENKDINICLAGGCGYPVSHHCTIFNRAWLMENLNEALKKNKHTPWEHEIYNFRNRDNVKKTIADHKGIRIGYVNYCTQKMEIHSVVQKGKLSQFGLNYLKNDTSNEYNH